MNRENQKAAQAKLEAEGYRVMIIAKVVPKCILLFRRRNDPRFLHFYFGIIKYPLMLGSYIEKALETKEIDEFAYWLSTHGAKFNMDVLHSNRCKITKRHQRAQAIALQTGSLLSRKESLLMMALAVDPENEPILKEEALPDLYQAFDKGIAQYLTT